MFKLEFVSDSLEEDGWLAIEGRITLGDHWETFISSLDPWDTERHEEQWREAAERLIAGKERSAFFTSLAPNDVSDYARWWPAWLDHDVVHITEQLLMFDQLETPFREEDPYIHVGDRTLFSEDEGLPVSYWSVGLGEIRAFAEYLARKKRNSHVRDGA